LVTLWALPGRELERLDRDRHAARRLADRHYAGSIALGVGHVVLVVVVEDIRAAHGCS
jgi:hypothetical protein